MVHDPHSPDATFDAQPGRRRGGAPGRPDDNRRLLVNVPPTTFRVSMPKS